MPLVPEVDAIAARCTVLAVWNWAIWGDTSGGVRSTGGVVVPGTISSRCCSAALFAALATFFCTFFGRDSIGSFEGPASALTTGIEARETLLELTAAVAGTVVCELDAPFPRRPPTLR